jgi:hypothetical protein
MKCHEIDLIACSEGVISQEDKNHIEKCAKCRKELDKLSSFSHFLVTHYAEGKKFESELDTKLQAIDVARMKKLPGVVAQKVRDLKETSLSDRLKRVIGKGKNEAEKIMKGMLTSQAVPMPASPKDITKTKKRQKKKKVT